MKPHIVHVPLQDFQVVENLVMQQLIPGVVLQLRAEPPPVIDYELLGYDERHALTYRVDYWLEIREPRTDNVAAASIANMWIFSLWLTRPTSTSIHNRFEKFDDSESSHAVRLISRAGYNQFDVDFRAFSADEILQAASYLEILCEVDASSRVGFALSLSVESTWVHRWSPGLMLASAAVESLLTYSEERRISTRHADVYAKVVARAGDRDTARNRFQKAYRRRSKLVHGRLPSATDYERLQDLAEWSRILRELWREILTRPSLLSALQGDDVARQAYFNTL